MPQRLEVRLLEGPQPKEGLPRDRCRAGRANDVRLGGGEEAGRELDGLDRAVDALDIDADWVPAMPDGDQDIVARPAHAERRTALDVRPAVGLPVDRDRFRGLADERAEQPPQRGAPGDEGSAVALELVRGRARLLVSAQQSQVVPIRCLGPELGAEDVDIAEPPQQRRIATDVDQCPPSACRSSAATNFTSGSRTTVRWLPGIGRTSRPPWATSAHPDLVS